MNKQEIYSAAGEFVLDILRITDTTNEKYYKIEKIIQEGTKTLHQEEKDLLRAMLTKANQLMWLNLTLERGAISAAQRETAASKKEALLRWFKKRYDLIKETYGTEEDPHS